MTKRTIFLHNLYLSPKKIFDEVISIHSRLRKNYDNKDLNQALQEAINKNKIPVYSRFRPKIKYIKQFFLDYLNNVHH